uniref:Putative hydroxypyruvate isomerase n=1 Tax=Heterorhabditis bacteriophora TaxID=37862 RepID=A0A1I7XHP1_HETBA
MLKQMKVAVNLNMFFPQLTLLERYQVAAAAGFKLVEVSLPYSESAETLRATADKLGLKHTLINAPTGRLSCTFIFLIYLHFFRMIIYTVYISDKYVIKISHFRVHIMAGIPLSGEENTEDLYVQNISYAANRLNNDGIICLIEPINNYTIPGYFLKSYEQAFSKDCDREGKLSKFEDTISMITKYKDDIGYIQIAQVPSRGAPNSPGEIDYKYIFRILSEANSNWIIGLEHLFTGDPEKLIEWISECGLST